MLMLYLFDEFCKVIEENNANPILTIPGSKIVAFVLS